MAARGKKSEKEIATTAPGPFRATQYKWRRLHEGNIIAEVALHPGMGLWRACAYRVGGGESEVAYLGHALSLLTDAHSVPTSWSKMTSATNARLACVAAGSGGRCPRRTEDRARLLYTDAFLELF